MLRFSLSIPIALVKEIDAKAKQEGRSRNAIINQLLMSSLHSKQDKLASVIKKAMREVLQESEVSPKVRPEASKSKKRLPDIGVPDDEYDL